MGCFGKCGCEGCCMSDAELSDIASSVTIEHTIYNQTATFSEGDCCHVAQIGDPSDYGTSCYSFITNDIRINETIITRARFIKSKTYVPDPPIETCFIVDFFEPPDYNEVCGDEASCGATLKTYSKIEKIAGLVRWQYGRTRVSIAKRWMPSPGSGEPQCKYVVECAIETLVQLGGLVKTAVTKSAMTSGGDGCCHPSSGWTLIEADQTDNPPGPDCLWNQIQPEPTFNCIADQDDAIWGSYISYWIRKVKIYDTAEDIPNNINFTNDDHEDCACEPCQDGVSELCINIIGDVLDPIQGGTLVTVVSQFSCGYCVQVEPRCIDIPCVEFIGNYCSCDPNGRIRNNHVQQGLFGFDSFAYVNNPYAVTNGVCMYPRLVDFTATKNYGDCDGCLFDAPPDFYIGQGVPPSERTDCNWFDCYNCLAGDDPFLPRIQPKQNTVDAYSFSSTAEEYIGNYCIPFPNVSLTLNP